MLSVRLPVHLENQLIDHCTAMQISKSELVQKALEKYLQTLNQKAKRQATINPFSALRGTGNRKYTTEQIMRMSRGADWNQP